MHESSIRAERHAPQTLLTNVLARVEHLDDIREPSHSTRDLLSSLGDMRWEVRATAIQELGARGEFDALSAALGDPHPAVRAVAIRVLGQRIPLDQLILAAQDADAEVSQTAHAFLAQMSHEQEVHSQAALAQQQPGPTVKAAVISAVHHFWLTLIGQALVFRRQWTLSALLLLISYGFTFFISVHFVDWRLAHASLMLAVVTTLASAFCVAFVCEGRHDAGLELALSTATSLRTVFFSRYLLVTLSNCALAAIASTIMAALLGQSIWSVTSLWLGPFLLVSSLTLTLALWLGSWLSFLTAALFAAIQTFRLKPDGGLSLMTHSSLWQTTPIMVAVATLLLVIALTRMPRHWLPSRETL